MLRSLCLPIAVTALMSAGLLTVPAFAGQSNVSTRTTENLDPFTRIARIANGSDPATIRFESIKAVELPTQVTETTNSDYCRHLQFRDPGGSMFCQNTRTTATVAGYAVTYSYVGQPLASDDYGFTRFTFQVFFRPDELSPEARAALSGAERKGREMAEYFTFSTYSERVQRRVINQAQSKFCAGNYVDGMWAHDDRACQDQIVYTTASVPSGYIAVKVDPVPSGAKHLGSAARSK